MEQCNDDPVNAQQENLSLQGIEDILKNCYTNEIYTNTPMSIEACIAHAIHSDLDILSALPEVQQLPVEDLETYIEHYILEIQESMRQVIIQKGDPFIRSKDAAGLCAICLEGGIDLPAAMLLKMCQTITQLSQLDARFILDTEDGTSLYYMKLELA